MAAAMHGLKEALPSYPSNPSTVDQSKDGNRVVAAEVYSQRENVAIDTEQDLEPLLAAIKRCPNLEILELCGYSFGVDAAARLGKLLAEKGNKLKTAQWADIFVSRNKPEVPVALTSLMDGLLKAKSQLTVLNLSDNAFGALGLESVVAYFRSPQAVHLQELYLNNNGLGIGGAKVLSSALSNPPPGFKKLEIGRNRLENHGAMAIASVLKKITTLEHLALPQNGIYFPGIEALADALSNNKKLQFLNLNDNTVGPKGAKALQQILPDMKELKVINLGDCLLKNQGAKLIFEALSQPNLPVLEILDVSFNEISAQCKTDLENAILWRYDLTTILSGNKFNTAMKNSLIERASGQVDFGKEESDDENEDDEDDEDDDDNEENDDDDGESTTEEYETEKNMSNFPNIKSNLFNNGVTITPVIASNDVKPFLNNPSKDSFTKLGQKPIESLLIHLQTFTEDDIYADEMVQIIFKLYAINEDTKEIFAKMKSWSQVNNYRLSLVANAFLVHLGFIKSEVKNKKLAGNTNASVKSFTDAIKTSAFTPQLRDMILFVIKDKCSKTKKIGEVDCDNYKDILSNVN